MNFPRIETERLILRAFEETDAILLVAGKITHSNGECSRFLKIKV